MTVSKLESAEVTKGFKHFIKMLLGFAFCNPRLIPRLGAIVCLFQMVLGAAP